MRHYPGQALGLPEVGSGAIAGIGRRMGAIFIDWLACTLIVIALIRPAQGQVEYWTLLIFAIQDLVLTAFTGVTLGKRLLSIRVVRVDGRMIGPAWAALRTLLLLVVIPAVVMDRDLRGMHDRAANAAVVRI